MKKKVNTTGGWMDFVERVKERIGRELTELEYKEMMQLYIKGKKPEDFNAESK